ncbi:hypothetical protein GCM10009601_04760 [Streptomyces thermospinosisporus]|uniref:Uncharacterized protein n=1 Tax=Streptomyces thermospinosisporus TaxID=161482 RepID=A0ABN1YNT0_9ACTN
MDVSVLQREVCDKRCVGSALGCGRVRRSVRAGDVGGVALGVVDGGVVQYGRVGELPGAAGVGGDRVGGGEADGGRCGQRGPDVAERVAGAQPGRQVAGLTRCLLEAADAQADDGEAELVGVHLPERLYGGLADSVEPVGAHRFARVGAVSGGVEAGHTVAAGQDDARDAGASCGLQDVVRAEHIDFEQVGQGRLVGDTAQVQDAVGARECRLHGGGVPQVDGVDDLVAGLLPEGHPVEQHQAGDLVAQRGPHGGADGPRGTRDGHRHLLHCVPPPFSTVPPPSSVPTAPHPLALPARPCRPAPAGPPLPARPCRSVRAARPVPAWRMSPGC